MTKKNSINCSEASRETVKIYVIRKTENEDNLCKDDAKTSRL
jgi:hypothetical protein